MIKVEEYIMVDPEVCHGKPCFKGTRIMVSSILELLEAEQTVPQILEAYPALTVHHIQAALHLASQLLDSERYLAFPRA